MTEHPSRLVGDEAAWTAAAATAARTSRRPAADASDSDVWDSLARRTVTGLTIPPLGTAARAAGLPTMPALAADPGEAPFLRGARTSGPWDVRQRVAAANPAAAHGAVMTALNGGVTSLWLGLGPGAIAVDDLVTVLDGVRVDAVPVVLDAPGADGAPLSAAASALAAVAAESGGPRGALHPDSNLGFDPVGAVARQSLDPDAARASRGGDRDVFGALPAVVADAVRLGIRAIVVDSSVSHDAGGDDTTEIGYAVAAGVAYLRALVAAGVDIDAACGLVEFRHAVTDDQFLSIAKLRAARLVWHRACELSGASPAARAARQHAVTSRAMMTRYDRYVNMLRGTVATFAAGVGGADAVTTLPFDASDGEPDEFGQRMARNVSALLLGESQVGSIADAAGGAYAVEMLTAELARAAWAELGRIEAAGGVLAALADGSVAGRVAAARDERTRRIAHRTMPITGVTEFPDPHEPVAMPGDGSDEAADRRAATSWAGSGWAGLRWAEPFEALRDRPTGSPVLLVRVGSQARASGRMLFTENLLAAGGIRFERIAADSDRDGTDAAGLARRVAETGCRTAVVAGSDADYRDSLAAVLRAVRDGGAASVFLAGRPRPLLADLPEGLIDGTVAVGDDVLAFLGTVREAVGAAS